MFPHKTIGRLVYDPHRGDMKRRTEWWCVVDIDREITRYYRQWLRFDRHIVSHAPAWDAHVSVIKGECPRPSRQHLWKKHHNKSVTIEYAHVGDVYSVPDSGIHSVNPCGEYYLVDVRCSALDDIRAELGLITGWNYHLSVARTHW